MCLSLLMKIYSIGRGKAVAGVQDMAICEVCERKLLFVLHVDGFLRMWDLASHTKLASHNTFSHELEGNQILLCCHQ